jgi:hypothetical protein
MRCYSKRVGSPFSQATGTAFGILAPYPVENGNQPVNLLEQLKTRPK